jgi:hypothetical protein
VLHRIKSKWDERLLHDSTKAWKKPAILVLILILAALISFISAATPATTAKGVQSVIVSNWIKF